MIQQIQEWNRSRQQWIAELKRDSGYFPQILLRNRIDPAHGWAQLFASTLVRLQREGVWYAVHVVESIVPDDNVRAEHLVMKITDHAWKVLHFYRVGADLSPDLNPVDALQESEEERLSKQMTHRT